VSNFKKFISNALLAGATAALVAFGVSLLLPRKWQVSGKIVVFPSGKPVSASQNLSEEVGNTAWIINSDTFQENNFGDFISDFSGAEVVKNSSLVLMKFRSSQADIQAVEDLIVKIPSEVNDYARDLYDGSPFKYKMIADPEVSANYIKPDLRKNSAWGFAGGLILYLIYWLAFEDFLFRKPKAEERIVEPEAEEVVPEEMKPEQPATIEEKPAVPEEKAEPISAGPAPDNLPITEEKPAVPSPNFHEPTDEEVKERLNRLMRGEL
jgi:hypothetical protein